MHRTRAVPNSWYLAADLELRNAEIFRRGPFYASKGKMNAKSKILFGISELRHPKVSGEFGQL